MGKPPVVCPGVTRYRRVTASCARIGLGGSQIGFRIGVGGGLGWAGYRRAVLPALWHGAGQMTMNLLADDAERYRFGAGSGVRRIAAWG